MPGIPPIFVVSGGTGASGEQVVRTALAQFRDVEVPVIGVPNGRLAAQLADVVDQAAALGGTIVYTLVDAGLRKHLIQMAHEKNVVAIDLMGQLLGHLAAVLGQEPLGQPGLYRQLRQLYFERVEAIEFTVAHDDGRNIHELDRAEVILVGVSRVGKTPLSIYLSVRGWKVANVPLIPDIPPPPELFQVDPRRVVGLTIQPAQLVAHRGGGGRRAGGGWGGRGGHRGGAAP
jgi:regulator of PEP synthase PpsR (kinase-PPPase family)